MLLGCGRGGRAKLVQAVHSRGRGAELRGTLGCLRHQGPVRAIVSRPGNSQPPWAVKDGQATIRISVHPHAGLDEVASVTLLGDLQDAAAVAHRVVVLDDPLLLHAENVLLHAEGHEGAAIPAAAPRLGRWHATRMGADDGSAPADS